MGPARAEVWWTDSALEGGGVFLGATIRHKSGRKVARGDECVRVDIVYDGDERGECESVLGHFFQDGSLRKLKTFDGENIPVRKATPPYSGSAKAKAPTFSGPRMRPAAQTMSRYDGSGVSVLLTVICAKLVACLDPSELRNALSVPTKRKPRRGSMVEASAPAECDTLLRQANLLTSVDATAESVIDAGRHLASLSSLTRVGNHIIGNALEASGSFSPLAQFYSSELMVSCFFSYPSDVSATMSRGISLRGKELAIPGAALFATGGPLPHAIMISTKFEPCEGEVEVTGRADCELFFVWGVLWTDGRISELTGLPASEAQPLTRRLCCVIESSSSTESGIALCSVTTGDPNAGTSEANLLLGELSLRWLNQKGDKRNLAGVYWKTNKAAALFGPDVRGFESVVGVLQLRSSYVVVAKSGAQSAKRAIERCGSSPAGPHP